MLSHAMMSIIMHATWLTQVRPMPQHRTGRLDNLGRSLNKMTSVLERLPDKRQGIDLDEPLQFFPVTKDNVRTNLPAILRQFLSYDLQQLHRYEAIALSLYTPTAQFQHPGATMSGREAICQFWNSFLIGRAFQRNDVHSLHVDIAWDPVKLQAFVQMEAWQHVKPLAWLDWLLKVPSWKIWTSFVLQFEEYPQDGPGALRVVFHEELVDQFLFLGLVHVGLYAVRTDPGTPLNFIRNMLRHAAGHVIATSTPTVVQLLEAVGWIKQ